MSENNHNDKDENIEEPIENEDKNTQDKNNKRAEDSEIKSQKRGESIKENLISDKDENVEKTSTNVELDENGEEVIVIYKKERNPVFKFLIGFIVFIIIAYITLFAVGFTMGLMRMKPPTIDENVWQNKWSEVTGGDEDTPDELEPADKSTPTPSDGGSS